MDSGTARAETTGTPPRRRKTIHHANTRARSGSGSEAGRKEGRKEKWGEAAGGEEEDEADFMRHLFPLKNGREQRARWSVGFVLRNPNPLMATTDGPATFKVSPPPDRMY